MLWCMTLAPPFLFFHFFQGETANTKCRKVCLYGKNTCKNSGGIVLCPRFVRFLWNFFRGRSTCQRSPWKNFGKNWTFFPCQTIKKLQIFGQKSLKISQNPQKSRGFSHTKRRLSKITINLLTVNKVQVIEDPADGAWTNNRPFPRHVLCHWATTDDNNLRITIFTELNSSPELKKLKLA